ncbi:hypothetical protein BN1232_06014 [Mycobacterium lentiflavum]|uniref:Uncharacterized protein n=1 Tax=Mycobacterium lentiflavum TaxID=141349 RepID=A0A0E4H1U4_MYCLN|nr:hypothetical protein BN1232_06014 [Mycobacterium lentiflavum]
MSRERDQLIVRVCAAMNAIAPTQLTLDELCRLVPIVEGAAEREAAPVDNVVTFGACRRRRARRVASRSQFVVCMRSPSAHGTRMTRPTSELVDRAAPALLGGGPIHFSINKRGTAAGFIAVRVRVICAGTVPARLAAVIIMIGRRMPAQRAGSTL